MLLSPPLRAQFTNDDDFDEIPDASPSLCGLEEVKEEETNHGKHKEKKTAFSLKLLLRVFDDTNNKDDAALGKPTMLLRMHCSIYKDIMETKSSRIGFHYFPEKNFVVYTYLLCVSADIA